MLLKLTFTLALTLVSVGVSASQSSSYTKGAVTSPPADATLTVGQLFRFTYLPSKPEGDTGFFQLVNLSLRTNDARSPAHLFGQDLSSAINASIDLQFRLPKVGDLSDGTGQTNTMKATLEVWEQSATRPKDAPITYGIPFLSTQIPVNINLGANSQ